MADRDAANDRILQSAVPFLLSAAEVYASCTPTVPISETTETLYRLAHNTLIRQHGDRAPEVFEVGLKYAAACRNRNERTHAYATIVENANRAEAWPIMRSALCGLVECTLTAPQDYPYACRALQQLVDLDARLFGEDDLTRTRHNLERLIDAASKSPGMAVVLDKASLRHFESLVRTDGMDSVTTWHTLFNIISVLRTQGKLRESVELVLNTPGVLAAMRSSTEPRSLWAASSFAEGMAKLERYAELEPVLRDVLAHANPTRANTVSTHVANITNHLARACSAVKKHAEAEELYRWSWVEMSTKYGADSVVALTTAIDVAYEQMAQRKHDKDTVQSMIETRDACVRARDKVPTEDFIRLTVALGHVLTLSDDMDAAARELRRAISLIDGTPVGAPKQRAAWLCAVRMDLAWILSQRGEFDRAIQMYTEARAHSVAGEMTATTRQIDVCLTDMREQIVALRDAARKRIAVTPPASERRVEARAADPVSSAPAPAGQVFVPPAETDEQSKECVACMDSNKDTVLLPCAHMCVCMPCATKMKSCPICRATVTQRVKVFM